MGLDKWISESIWRIKKEVNFRVIVNSFRPKIIVASDGNEYGIGVVSPLKFNDCKIKAIAHA